MLPGPSAGEPKVLLLYRAPLPAEGASADLRLGYRRLAAHRLACEPTIGSEDDEDIVRFLRRPCWAGLGWFG